MTIKIELDELKSPIVRLGFEVKTPLSHNQILVGNHILHNLIKQHFTLPKSIQLIAQPQSGKTNTVLYLVAIIDYISNRHTDLYLFGPSDTELSNQNIKRFTHAEDATWSIDEDPIYGKFSRGEPIPKPDKLTTIMPSNIKGRTNELEDSINISRRNSLRWRVFIHDENHRDGGSNESPANLSAFYEKNKIMLNPVNVKNNESIERWINSWKELKNDTGYNQEICINISASPASYIQYIRTLQLGEDKKMQFMHAYYLRPHANYLSFKDIWEKGRFKEGFEINKKANNIRKFIIEIVCQNLLLSKPGCLIVRLNPGANLDQKIREKIEEYNEDFELLKENLYEFLNHDLLTPENIQKIKINLLKVKTLNFDSKSDTFLTKKLEYLKQKFNIKNINDENNNLDFKKEREQQISLFESSNKSFEIGAMNYFMNDEVYQNEEYRILCITNSFLQGKTFNSLNNIRGWFERFNSQTYHNNCFTIQSIGRNCGNYKNCNYTYPIWTNIDEMEKIINAYQILEDNADIHGFIDPKTFTDDHLQITGTYTKVISQKAKKALFKHNPRWETKVCSTRLEIDNFLSDKLYKHQGIKFDGIGDNYNGISVSKNNENNVMYDIINGNVARYRKRDTNNSLSPYGIIYLDNPNTKCKIEIKNKDNNKIIITGIQSWNDSINNPECEEFYQKHNQFLVFIERSYDDPIRKAFENIPIIKDTSFGYSEYK